MKKKNQNRVADKDTQIKQNPDAKTKGEAFDLDELDVVEAENLVVGGSFHAFRFSAWY